MQLSVPSNFKCYLTFLQAPTLVQEFGRLYNLICTLKSKYLIFYAICSLHFLSILGNTENMRIGIKETE